MKLELNQESAFKPFTITLTIESKREALMLQALTNNQSALRDFINESNMSSVPKDYTMEEVRNFATVWHLIDNQI